MSEMGVLLQNLYIYETRGGFEGYYYEKTQGLIFLRDSGRKLSRKVKIEGGGGVFVDGNGKYVGENLEEDIQV